MDTTLSRTTRYLTRYASLPKGCLLYRMTQDGRLFVAGNGKVGEITKDNPEYENTLHVFVNSGNKAHYLLGNPNTSASNPNNATVKMGITDAHHHFTPHVHGSQHYVKSEGFSGCLLYDHKKRKAFAVKLLPGTLIYLPEWIPHAFYNRSDVPLITLIANGGLGIHNEEYAQTRADIEKRLQGLQPKDQEDLRAMSDELSSIEEFLTTQKPEYDLDTQERIASKLYTVAEYFSTH